MKITKLIKDKDSADFSDAVKLIKLSDPTCSHVEAMRRARKAYPGLFAAYQESGKRASQAFAKARYEPVRKQTSFDQRVAELLAENPKMKRCDAMRQVHDSRPDLLKEMQAA